MTEYDVLIVGSGAAGGTAAYTLTKAGAKVLVLEAGPPNSTRAFDRKAASSLPFRGFGDPNKVPHVFQANEGNENQWVSEQQVPYTHAPGAEYNWVRVRMTGGRSNYWARMSFRLSDYEFKAKDFDGFGENWPIAYADLAPYYDKIDPIFRVTGKSEGLKQLPDSKFVVERTVEYTGVAQKIVAAATKRSMPNTLTRSSQGQGGSASSTSLTLPAAMETGNLTLVPNAVVREVTVDKTTGLANGVHFVDRLSGREMSAKAKIVVLAAGTLESTRILLNSNVANSSGALGRYLIDQFYINNSIWAVHDSVKGQTGAGYMPRFRNLEKSEKHNFIRGYALQWSCGGSPGVEYFPGYGEGPAKQAARYQNCGFTCTVMGDVLPRRENHVRLNKDQRDQWGIPTLHIDCRYTDNEFNMAKDSIAVLEELATEAGLEVITKRPEMFPPGYSIHELGTCRMGDDPKTSVLNKWNQTHDVKNLFVVDGASFTTAGYQNPTITIAALSMRACEYIADQKRQGSL